MNSGDIMIIVVVIVVMVASIIKAGMRTGVRVHDQIHNSPRDNAEVRNLRQEVAELKDRIKVLERIAVEKEDTLARQIEELRDR